MLTAINIYSSVPVYVQIENEIRFAIASGRLKAGERLPSVRELSELLRVNPNTVAKSYRDLEVMGYLYTRRGMGVFVKKAVQASCRKACYRDIIERFHETVQEAKAAGMSKAEVKELAERCLASESSPYGETPNSLMDSAKEKSDGAP